MLPLIGQILVTLVAQSARKVGKCRFLLGPMQPKIRSELSLVKEGNGCWVVS